MGVGRLGNIENGGDDGSEFKNVWELSRSVEGGGGKGGGGMKFRLSLPEQFFVFRRIQSGIGSGSQDMGRQDYTNGGERAKDAGGDQGVQTQVS